jgi:Uma2 family endonuclease
MNAQIEATLDDDIYPDSDGKPMAETGIHVEAIIWLYQMLRHHFRDREDIYIAADMFLYYVEGQPKKRRAPDVMVAKGVKGRHERRSFKTWVEGVVPACIVEVTSKKTTQEDLKQKNSVYQKIGVREYFMFDPLHEYLPQQLIGYRLVAKKYQRIKPGPDGSLLSKELGLRLCPHGTKLALYDSKTGVRVQTMDELYEAAEVSQRMLDEERKRLEEEHRKLEQERRRNAELQAELARLKASQGKPSGQ